MTYNFEIILFFKEIHMHVRKTLQMFIGFFFLDFTFKENMYAEVIIVEMLSSLTNQ